MLELVQSQWESKMQKQKGATWIPGRGVCLKMMIMEDIQVNTAIRDIYGSKTSYLKVSDLACVKFRKRYGWMLVVWGPSLFDRKLDSLILCFCFMSDTLSRSWDCLLRSPKERVQVQYSLERDLPLNLCDAWKFGSDSMYIYIYIGLIRFYVTIQCEPIRLRVVWCSSYVFACKCWVEPAMVSSFLASREPAGCRTGRDLNLSPTADGQNLVNQWGRFKSVVTVVHTVDGRNPAPPGMYCKQWDKLPINWCRISEPSTVGYFLHQHTGLVSRISANQHREGTMSSTVIFEISAECLQTGQNCWSCNLKRTREVTHIRIELSLLFEYEYYAISIMPRVRNPVSRNRFPEPWNRETCPNLSKPGTGSLESQNLSPGTGSRNPVPPAFCCWGKTQTQTQTHKRTQTNTHTHTHKKTQTQKHQHKDANTKTQEHKYTNTNPQKNANKHRNQKTQTRKHKNTHQNTKAPTKIYKHKNIQTDVAIPTQTSIEHLHMWDAYLLDIVASFFRARVWPSFWFCCPCAGLLHFEVQSLCFFCPGAGLLHFEVQSLCFFCLCAGLLHIAAMFCLI